jgi:hypothetical protein
MPPCSVETSERSLTAPFADLEPFLALVGGKRWLERMAEIRGLAALGPRAGQAVRQRHAVELALEKRRRQPLRDGGVAGPNRGPCP